jgi:hypothetical protein
VGGEGRAGAEVERAGDELRVKPQLAVVAAVALAWAVLKGQEEVREAWEV